MDALFVGWERQENLGLRHIMAYLQARGHRTGLVAYAPDAIDQVVETALREQPRVLGFSIIFQYNLREFGALMSALRRAGVRAHFTAGGHYPSLRPEQTLAELPELDSLVRFEGEITTAELLDRVDHPERWPEIEGLVWKRHGGIVVNRPRPLVTDLDSLPWPARGDTLQLARGIPVAPMLASRGCLFDCSFCSIRQFYAEAPGAPRRVRSPENVAAEMRALYDGRGVRLFLFQDDDFAAKTPSQRAWIDRFLGALDREGLTGRIGWKISCRVDDVDAELFSRCRARGLLTVYLGVESGNSAGLATLNKRVTVDQNIRALHTLTRVGVDFDMGFMLLDPGTTFASIRENVAFLRRVAAFGGLPITFVKMLPLAGTAIEQQLMHEGRMTGDPIRPDYRFLDHRVDYYALWLTLRFSNRNSAPDGLVEALRMAYFDHLVARTFEGDGWTAEYGRELRALIDLANDSALSAVEESLALVEDEPDAAHVALRWRDLNRIAERDRRVQVEVLERLDRTAMKFSPELRSALNAAAATSAGR